MIATDPNTGYVRNAWPMLSAPLNSATDIVLSLGAGVQSTTLALMAARREIGPMPSYAAFADTGAEPRAVYRHLEWLATQLPFPIVRVRREGLDLGAYHTETARLGLAKRSTIPLYTAEPHGMLAKQCSKEFKTRPVQREIRRRAGLAPRQRAPAGFMVELWVGMSKDEMFRVKRSETAYIHTRHPLVEADMTRQDCLRWLEERQYPRPPKSSCIFCPFRDNAAWIDMGRNQPEDFTDAIAYDDTWRDGYPGMEGTAYVHRNRIPLRDLDLSQPAEQAAFAFVDQEQCDACGY